MRLSFPYTSSFVLSFSWVLYLTPALTPRCTFHQLKVVQSFLYDGTDASKAICEAALKAGDTVTSFSDTAVYIYQQLMVNNPQVFLFPLINSPRGRDRSRDARAVHKLLPITVHSILSDRLSFIPVTNAMCTPSRAPTNIPNGQSLNTDSPVPLNPSPFPPLCPFPLLAPVKIVMGWSGLLLHQTVPETAPDRYNIYMAHSCYVCTLPSRYSLVYRLSNRRSSRCA